MKKFFCIICFLAINTFFAQKKETTNSVSKTIVTEKNIETVTIEPNSELTEAPGEIVYDENSIYPVFAVEEKPEFPGGIEKFHFYISKRFNYSNEMKEAQLKGKVLASFVVEKNGNISEIKILRDIGYDSGKELLRILKGMPNWKSAVQKGKNVRCNFLIPIVIDATRP